MISLVHKGSNCFDVGATEDIVVERWKEALDILFGNLTIDKFFSALINYVWFEVVYV